MATCDPKTLLSGAACDLCALTHKQLLASMVALLCKANNMNCDPKSLLAAANCILCSMTEKQMLASMVNLLCVGGGTGGGASGSGQIVAYTGANPNADGVKPANTQLPAIAVKPAGTTYTWSIAAQNWQ